MILSAKFLKNVSGVNNFEYVRQAEFSEGDALTLYFQLVDMTKQACQTCGYGSACLPGKGLRYLPAAGSTLQVLIENLNDAKKVTRFATQPYAQDPSIWALTIMATDPIVGTAGISLTLTEPGPVVTRGRVENALRVYPTASF